MSEHCLDSEECRPYCGLLNSLTGREQDESCSWPDLNEGEEGERILANASNPELATRSAARLTDVLKTGNHIRRLFKDMDSELSIAH